MDREKLKKGRGRKFHISQHWKEIRAREQKYKRQIEKETSPKRKLPDYL